MPSAYTIVRQPTGEWHMYRDGELVDIEWDPERSPLAEIFRWATAVAWAEDHTEVREWRPIDERTFASVAA
jgi:hypothetical protein